MVSSRGGLDIAQLIFYLPVWAITVLVCRRHGWGRSDGWIFLFFFVMMRLVGAISGIIADSDSHNIGAMITTAVMNGGGTSTLLMTQIGILRRLNSALYSSMRRIPQRAFDLVVLALVALLGVAIAAGVFLFSTQPTRQETGLTLLRVTGGLAIGIFSLTVFGLSWVTTNMWKSASDDRILLFASWAAFPFLLVKVVYLALTTLGNYPGLFSYQGSNIYALAFMSAVPEFIVVIIYLTAGWKAPEGKIREGTARAHAEQHSDGVALNSYSQKV